ncbi:hypothetical protein J1N35_016648 [Gossypium stocksii]|uniref:Uncharacterized protein n=1 Tax=Gossypium stocksii TaxID=47602 RepID=A0A9D3VKK2_9ROSI|nr:hypothetical protein J1N35_016648 [Gossypium stocksii]
MWHWHGNVGYNNTEGAKVWNLKLDSEGWFRFRGMGMEGDEKHRRLCFVRG